MVLTYDGTFEGLLSAIFETYLLEQQPVAILPAEEWRDSLFEAPVYVPTRKNRAQRVQKGIIRQCNKTTPAFLYRCFLSELPHISMLIYDFIRKAMDSPKDISDNYADETVLKLRQVDKKIAREVHRMHAFVRFQLTRDHIYYAVINPDFNVLPLLPPHFEKRYPAQQWLIYDRTRRYGIYYDKEKTEYITFPETPQMQLEQPQDNMLDTVETDYQRLWQSYFESANIPERKNRKLHLQHVPKRYWKYLTEKHGKN